MSELPPIPDIPDEPPAAPSEGAPKSRYDSKLLQKTMLITAGSLIALMSLGFVVPTMPFALVWLAGIPIGLVSMIIAASSRDVRTKSIWMGITIGNGIFLVVGFGLCTAMLNSSGF